MKPARGFSLLELVFTSAIFGILLLILATLGAELTRLDRRPRIAWFAHPEKIAVLVRAGTDILDSANYPQTFAGLGQSTDVLLLELPGAGGEPETVVWDFREQGVARRSLYRGETRVNEWMARGVPRFSIESFEMPDQEIAVRLRAYDSEEKLIVDRIFQPRAE
ncbi:MAG TPA: prepilin-type N-terminal cleavage/methylation domain-containing protein [Thermoanaerobaculia bacterium]|nr:prepilin-type N-terminal cleavage/methylation domain-containing protein [Thermoanaerobaculia bacterium]